MNLSEGKKKISFLLSILVFATSLFSISSASANPDISLPSGETLYAIQYSGSNTGSLFSIDPKTGTQTPIGIEDSIDSGRAVAATFNPKTKTGYWTSTGDRLYSVNLLTGKSTDLGQMLDNGTAIWHVGIGTNSDGQMYILYQKLGDQYRVGKLNELNGSITDSHAVESTLNTLLSNEAIYGSFAFNPATSTFYSTPYADDKAPLWSIDTSGEGSLIATSNFSEVPANPCGLAIDSNGNFWTVSAETGNTFSTGKLSDWERSQASSQQFTIDGIETYTLFIAPSPDDGAAQRAAAARNSAAAAAAYKQRELTEILSIIPAIAGLALNLAVLTNYLIAPQKSSSAKQKCVNGSSTTYVKKGTKCPVGYTKKK